MRAGLLALLLFAGCGKAERDGGSVFADGGAVPIDAGVVDPQRPSDGGLPAGERTPDYHGPTVPGSDMSEGSAACFEPSEEPAFFECDDAVVSRCAELRSCCIGDGACCSAVSGGPLPARLAFGACADGDAASCLGADVTAFGDPPPLVRDGTLLPNGDADYDSGLLVGDPIDLTAHRVEISTAFRVPGDCAGSCLEGVAVGLTNQAALGETSHVRLSVGLLYSGGRNDVGLVIGGEIVERWSLPDGAMDEAWKLVVRPDGDVVVHRGSGAEATIVAAARFAPTSAARLVVYGRNDDHAATDAPAGAGLASLEVHTALCDMPRAWPTRDALTLSASGEGWDPPSLKAPSLAYGADDRALVALAHGDHLLVARRPDASDALGFEILGSPDVSVVAPSTGTTLRDPELVADAETGGGWVLFYTIEEGTAASIGRADGGPEGFSARGEPVIKAGGTGFEDFARIEQPTVHVHYGGTWVMVARTTAADGSVGLTLFTSSTKGASWSPFSAGDLAALTGAGGVAPDGFDTDELAHPSLIVHDGAWQLYYAGRRGTRWGIGLLVSDELLRWRSVGQVLSGDGDGFDRLSVGAPDAASRPASVEILYQASDGARDGIGRAWRQASEHGTRGP